MNNFFDLPEPLPHQEQFEILIQTASLLVERIISPGQSIPGEWYDQDQDEWVMLVQGQAILEYEDGSQKCLQAGNYLMIPAHQRHRVIFTSAEPPCLWLAIHGELLSLKE